MSRRLIELGPRTKQLLAEHWQGLRLISRQRTARFNMTWRTSSWLLTVLGASPDWIFWLI